MGSDIAGLVHQGPSIARRLLGVLLLALLTSCTPDPSDQEPQAPELPHIPEVTAIMPGQRPSPTPMPFTSASPAAFATEARDRDRIHIVEPGDTLLGLAREYQVPMAAIQLENDQGESTVVVAGQALVIPSPEEWSNGSPFWILHEVRPNETLGEIALAYGLELERLRIVNGLDDTDDIAAGRHLILPLTGPVSADDTPVPERTSPTPSIEAVYVPSSTQTVDSQPEATPTTNSVGTSDATAILLTPTHSVGLDVLSWREEIRRQINEVRDEHGLPALMENTTLADVAQAHATDCAQRGWCSHTGSDGADIETRITRAGYHPQGWAECWAQTRSPAEAVEIWMDEMPPNDPHRRTLLSDWLTQIGIGVSEAEWGYYVVADFARP